MIVELIRAALQVVAFIDQVLTVLTVMAIAGVLLTTAGVVGLVRARRAKSSC
jgi:hypothetical protein